MDACAHPGAVTVHLDLRQRLLGVEGGRHGLGGVVEHGHDPVAQPLDDLAASGEERALDGVAHGAQQFQRRLVAGLQGPGGEAHEVGEDDGDVAVAPATSGRLGDRLPDLERAEPGGVECARPLGAPGR